MIELRALRTPFNVIGSADTNEPLIMQIIDNQNWSVPWDKLRWKITI